MYINCGIDPVHPDIQIPLDEVTNKTVRTLADSNGVAIDPGEEHGTVADPPGDVGGDERHDQQDEGDRGVGGELEEGEGRRKQDLQEDQGTEDRVHHRESGEVEGVLQCTYICA